jgi:hypothetical protein
MEVGAKHLPSDSQYSMAYKRQMLRHYGQNENCWNILPEIDVNPFCTRINTDSQKREKIVPPLLH